MRWLWQMFRLEGTRWWCSQRSSSPRWAQISLWIAPSLPQGSPWDETLMSVARQYVASCWHEFGTLSSVGSLRCHHPGDVANIVRGEHNGEWQWVLGGHHGDEQVFQLEGLTGLQHGCPSWWLHLMWLSHHENTNTAVQCMWGLACSPAIHEWGAHEVVSALGRLLFSFGVIPSVLVWSSEHVLCLHRAQGLLDQSGKCVS